MRKKEEQKLNEMKKKMFENQLKLRKKSIVIIMIK